MKNEKKIIRNIYKKILQTVKQKKRKKKKAWKIPESDEKFNVIGPAHPTTRLRQERALSHKEQDINLASLEIS